MVLAIPFGTMAICFVILLVVWIRQGWWDTPLGRSDWRQKIARDRAADAGTYLIWLAVATFAAMAWAAAKVHVRESIAYVLLTIMIATVAGVGVMGVARQVRFGRPLCRFNQLPIAIGSSVSGEVVARFRKRPTDVVSLRLTCVQNYVPGPSADVRNPGGQSEMYSAEVRLKPEEIQFVGDVAHLPFAFDIPNSALPTRYDRLTPVRWWLTARAEMPLFDYRARFQLPVFLAP